MRTLLVSGTLIMFFGASAVAQGTFQNLDFEDANVVPITGSFLYPYAVTVANALPGWTVEYGTVQQTQITYNDVSLGGTAATLIADGYPSADTLFKALDGNFSALLYGGPTSISLSQTGQIPSGTQSLFFEWGGVDVVRPEVSIGGDNLSLFPVRSGVYGANISAWAGQTEQLTFTVPAGYGPYRFDDISFSPGAVPEPNALALIGIGGVLFAAFRRFAPQRKLELSLDS